MTKTTPNRSRPSPTKANTVNGVLESYLATLALDGADLTRAEIARKLARELDDPASPRHTIPSLSSQLRGVLADLDPKPTNGSAGNGKVDLAALLAPVRNR
jgi:hypothetical protein